jgi:hypothetical protein
MADIAPHSKPGPLSSFPLLALVLITYNVAPVLGYSFASPTNGRDVVLQTHLISGAEWMLTWKDVLLLSGLLLLFIELLKSTRAATQNMLGHILSMIVFIIFLAEFLVVAEAGTSTFLILGVMSLIDVLAGYTISVAVARKEMNVVG